MEQQRIEADRTNDDQRAPSLLLALTELPRALIELAFLPFADRLLHSAPRGDGHPVLVLPGFIAGDASTALLRRYLTRLGYDVHGWALGRNLGPRAVGPEGEKLLARLHAIHRDAGDKVSLVGWSLGGVMARFLAHRAPEAVRQVVTFGAPFAGDPKATNVWRLYELLTGQRLDDHRALSQLAEAALPPDVPCATIYSRGDGVVAWRNCVENGDHATEHIEVRGSHCGMAVNPTVLYAIATRLARIDRD